MTLLYKLLGIPRTIDEAVEKADRSKHIPNIFVKRHQGVTLTPGCAIFNYRVGVNIILFGFIDYGVIEHKWGASFENYIHGIDNQLRLNSEDEHARNVAHELAEKLATTNGFRVVRINGEFHNLFQKKFTLETI